MSHGSERGLGDRDATLASGRHSSRIRAEISREEASNWWGVAAPKNTPVAIINTLNGAINAGLVDPQMRARLIDLGGTPLAGSPADFQKLIVDETEKWAKVVRFSGAKPE